MFSLKSKYTPSGDQGKAIEQLTSFIEAGHKWQTLWGVTGSGKTFTMANLIEKIGKPTLIIAHNKTLAAQLANEFKEFFPDAAVHYFVSYYDYYQPEAYVTKTDTYIEKEATINKEIDRLRHAATQSLLSRDDVIIVASVSCIYGIGDVQAYHEQVLHLEVGKEYRREELLKSLVDMQFTRAGDDFGPGNFHVMGETLEIWPASMEKSFLLEFWGDELSDITLRQHLSHTVFDRPKAIDIFPAKHTVTSKATIKKIIPQIQKDLEERLAYFQNQGDVLRYERLKAKVEYDIEMMQEVGYVSGIENYSRYLDGRKIGEPPATLIDFFGDDFLTIIDESHMTLPQIGAMYGGDRSRKVNLVENGFRLPAALDNRPLTFEEFVKKTKQVLAVSATPASYEIEHSSKSPDYFFAFDPTQGQKWESSQENRIAEQIIRPTGLLDPEIEIESMENMVDSIMGHIDRVISKNQRMLVTTLTKKTSEELSEYLQENGIKVKYLHSEIDTLERLEILRDLRLGEIDVIVGVNLLREGLDLPEVSHIAILDADKQGFLRSTSSLIQIIGRAARNSQGKVSMYVQQISQARVLEIQAKNKSRQNLYSGEKLWVLDQGKYIDSDGFVISQSMKKAIDLTYYRRSIQIQYNAKNNITPTTVLSSIKDINIPKKKKITNKADKIKLQKQLKKYEIEMDLAVSHLDFEKAAELRDEIFSIRKSLGINIK